MWGVCQGWMVGEALRNKDRGEPIPWAQHFLHKCEHPCLAGIIHVLKLKHSAYGVSRRDEKYHIENVRPHMCMNISGIIPM